MSSNKLKSQTNEENGDFSLTRSFTGYRQASGDIGDIIDPIKMNESSLETNFEEITTSPTDQIVAYPSCDSNTLNLMNKNDNDTKSESTEVSIDSTGSQTNQTNLIVNYLPPYMSQDEVKALFSSVGEVESCKLVREKSTGESLGYAFVKFVKPNQAAKAVNRLNGLRLQNKTIKVSLARPSSDSIKGANLYICGLPRRMTQNEIETLFGQYGKIITARILYDNRTGVSRGIAFIRFDQKYEAELAIKKLNGYRPSVEYPDAGSVEPIVVKFANSPTALRHENLSMALIKQAVNGNNLAKSLIVNPFGAMKSSDFLMSQFLGPALMASSGALTSQGWCLFVYNLSAETGESDLWQLFGPFGAVQSVKVNRDVMANKCRGYAFVTMTNYEEALMAVQALNGVMIGDRFLQVSFKTHGNYKMRNVGSSAMYSPFIDDTTNSYPEAQSHTNMGAGNRLWKRGHGNLKHTPGSRSLLKNLSISEDVKTEEVGGGKSKHNKN